MEILLFTQDTPLPGKMGFDYKVDIEVHDDRSAINIIIVYGLRRKEKM